METKYKGDLSYPDPDGQKGKKLKQEVTISEIPRTESCLEVDLQKWKKTIREKIGKAIESGNLREIEEGEQCNLFVTFKVSKSNQDVDNLLQVLLDALKKSDKKFTKVKNLIPDDAGFRGIRAEREIVKTKPGVHIQYVITKTFEILEVKNESGERFRSYWKSPMQYITAYGMINGKKKECQFIDNMPRQLFLVDNDYAKLIPPGYDWKSMKGKSVDGCMVFQKKLLKIYKGETRKDERYFWLTKWS